MAQTTSQRRVSRPRATTIQRLQGDITELAEAQHSGFIAKFCYPDKHGQYCLVQFDEDEFDLAAGIAAGIEAGMEALLGGKTRAQAMKVAKRAIEHSLLAAIRKELARERRIAARMVWVGSKRRKCAGVAKLSAWRDLPE